jgi:hypothetical protein
MNKILNAPSFFLLKLCSDGSDFVIVIDWLIF